MFTTTLKPHTQLKPAPTKEKRKTKFLCTPYTFFKIKKTRTELNFKKFVGCRKQLIGCRKQLRRKIRTLMVIKPIHEAFKYLVHVCRCFLPTPLQLTTTPPQQEKKTKIYSLLHHSTIVGRGCFHHHHRCTFNYISIP